MKVKELIEKLKEYDEEMQVVIDGFSGGYSKITNADIIEIQENDIIENFDTNNIDDEYIDVYEKDIGEQAIFLFSNIY